MPQFVRKYWKRWLLAAAMVLLCPLLLLGLLWWDNLPKPDARVSIGYLCTTTQGNSNVVTFVVTNQSDFPIHHVVVFLSTSTNGGWAQTFPFGQPNTWLIDRTLGKSTSTVSVGVFSTNHWRLQILGSDARPEMLGKARGWVAWRLRELDYRWAWRLQGKVIGQRAQVSALGPEMLGDSPAP